MGKPWYCNVPELFDHRGMKKRHAVLVVVSIHERPVSKDGRFVQIPRYQFDPKTYDRVP